MPSSQDRKMPYYALLLHPFMLLLIPVRTLIFRVLLVRSGISDDLLMRNCVTFNYYPEI